MKKFVVATVVSALTIFAIAVAGTFILKDHIKSFLYRDGGRELKWEVKDDGIKFKTPVGAVVNLNIASADTVVPTAVIQEGGDTWVKLSPVGKKA